MGHKSRNPARKGKIFSLVLFIKPDNYDGGDTQSARPRWIKGLTNYIRVAEIFMGGEWNSAITWRWISTAIMDLPMSTRYTLDSTRNKTPRDDNYVLDAKEK